MLFLEIVFLFCVSASAKQNTDSLENILNTNKLNQIEKLTIYKDLSDIYLENNLSKAILYANEGIKLIEKDDQSIAIALYKNIGIAYTFSSKFDSAKICLEKALEYAQIEKDTEIEASIYGSMGNMYNLQQSFQEALEYYLKAYTYYESNGKELDAAKILINIAALYENTNNHQKALEYLHKVENVARKYEDKSLLAKSLSNMASIYGTDLYQEWDMALQYAEEAYNIFESIGSLRNQSITTQRFVIIYTYYLNDYKKALEWAEKGLQIAEELGSDNQAAFSLTQKTSIYFMMGEYKDCIHMAKLAILRDTTDLTTATMLYGLMTVCYAYIHDMDSALIYLNHYYTSIVGTTNEDFQRSFSEMEVKYEIDKKEMKIAAMQEERKLYIWLGISLGLILLLALLIFIIRQRLAVSRHKLAEQQVKQLEQEKKLIATQAVLDGETAERTRLAKDLHDGLGGMLSAVKLNLSDVKKDVTIVGEDVQLFDHALSMLNDSIIELRRVAHNMMPDSLTRCGLKISLTDFCNNIPGVEFHYFGNDSRLDSKLEIMIYRTVHELVNNAIKHSGAGHILVQMIQEEDRISFTVQDDGIGFDTSASNKGTGIHNIRDRVNSYSGQLNIWSEVGKGTEINVELKLKNKSEI